MGGTTTEMGEKTITIKGLTLEEVRKQSEITAKDVIRQLEESVNHSFICYPELIGILKFYLKKSIEEMKLFRPNNLPLSLKEVGLDKIYKALVNLEKKEETRKKDERQ